VPEAVIMKLCGWKTRTVFNRYRIVAERDLAEGLAKLRDLPRERAQKGHNFGPSLRGRRR
jgi:hypothetical protein